VALVVAANVGVFVAQQAVGPAGAIWYQRFGLLPRALWEGERIGVAGAIQPYALVLLTAGFLHAGIGHLAINLAYLGLLGPSVERAIGWWRFGAVWLGATIVGGLTHAAVHPQSLVPAIGASAGVSGLIGLVTLGGKAGLLIGAIWLGVQLAGALTQIEDVFGPAVAWDAHLGGFGVGLAAGALFRLNVRRRARMGPKRQ
jgi:membrane associated rhomboid family serine protease